MYDLNGFLGRSHVIRLFDDGTKDADSVPRLRDTHPSPPMPSPFRFDEETNEISKHWRPRQLAQYIGLMKPAASAHLEPIAHEREVMRVILRPRQKAIACVSDK
ncbi:hypothetical protein ABIF97_004156 [Bradyrhizobium japonicum]